jgi:hypothetical protein
MLIPLTFYSFPIRYPAQEQVGGDSKIPTVILYDQSGNVQAVGAAAISEVAKEAAEENGWIKAEWCRISF